MKQQLNEVQKLQKIAGILKEEQIKIYNTYKTKESIVDLNLIDTLVKQIGPVSGYSDWEERASNLDYKAIINGLAKQMLNLGSLESDRIKF